MPGISSTTIIQTQTKTFPILYTTILTLCSQAILHTHSLIFHSYWTHLYIHTTQWQFNFTHYHIFILVTLYLTTQFHFYIFQTIDTLLFIHLIPFPLHIVVFANHIFFISLSVHSFGLKSVPSVFKVFCLSLWSQSFEIFSSVWPDVTSSISFM